MLSFQDLYTLCQNMSQDTTAASLTFFKQQLSVGQRLLEAEIGSYVTEDSRAFTSINGTVSYPLPENFIRLKELYCVIGNVRYVAQEVYNEDEWQVYFTSSSSIKSDFLSRVMVRRATFEVFPIPASAQTLTMIYERQSQDLSNDDFTTGTIASLATSAGQTTVTGSGTSWTTNMAGRFIQFSGDTQWYEISSVTNSTHIVLVGAYQGTFTSGTYKIGELPRTPSPTHMIPVYFSMMNYQMGIKKDANFGKLYQQQYKDLMQWAKSTYGNRYSQKVIMPSSQHLAKFGNRNPNFYPISIG